MNTRDDNMGPAAEELERRLRQSIDMLCENAARVEVWATALSAFAHPVPRYEPPDQYRLGTFTPARR